jgi:predicted aspartyl protease
MVKLFMGTFKVKTSIWRVDNPSRRVGVELIVDTGATYTMIPQSLLEELGVKKIRVIRLRLANNTVVERPLGEIGIEVEGYNVSATPVIFGYEEIYLLGSVTMEQLGLAPDPVEKRLKPVEALLL